MKNIIRAVIWSLLLFVFVVDAGYALAHGDTIRVSYARVQPERLVVIAGTTVHFHNANQSGAPCTVVIGEGEAKRPALGRADGWHYTFETAGTFSFFIEEFPSRSGTVIVSPGPKSRNDDLLRPEQASASVHLKAAQWTSEFPKGETRP